MCSSRSSAGWPNGPPTVPADELATTVRGAGPRLVLVHGFTQTARSWDDLAVTLADRFEVVAVDAPGHGGSAAVRADVRRSAHLIGAAGGRGTYIGYSMGGRMCLQLAVDRPHMVERLVVISATAGIDDEAPRADRRRDDEALARSVERDGVPAFLERWVGQPIFAGLPDPGLADRRRNTAEGLASSLRMSGTGNMQPLWERLGELRLPVLVIAGAGDAKFVLLAERLTAAIPDAELAIVEGAGHTVHLERPEAFVALVRSWLSR